jgi:hypothetical protein
MHRLLVLATTLALGLVAGGCCQATVNVLPKEGGQGEAISQSASENCALEKAQQNADEYCQKQGKHYVAIKSDSKYQGADPNAKLAVGVLTGHNGNTSQDYRVSLEFKCE